MPTRRRPSGTRCTGSATRSGQVDKFGAPYAWIPILHEARVYLGHLLYDRGDWEGALRELERVPPLEHWDALAVWRLMELKRTLWHLDHGDARLAPWAARLEELEADQDPIDRLLSEVEARMGVVDSRSYYDPTQLELFERALGRSGGVVTVRLADGTRLSGSWIDLVRQMRDRAGFSHEDVSDFMRRLAERWHEQSGQEIPSTDPESFVRGRDRGRPDPTRAGRVRVSRAPILERFHRALIEEIQTQRPEYLTGPFTVAEIYQNLVPYGSHRDRIGVSMNADYEDTLLRLLAGEGEYLVLESEAALRSIRAELDTSNPNTGMYREYAAVDVRLNQGRLDLSAAAVAQVSDLSEMAVADPPLTMSDLAPSSPEGSEDPHPSGGLQPEFVEEETVPSEVVAPPRAVSAAGACWSCASDLPDRDGVNFCPHCGADLSIVLCRGCGSELESGWRFCASCGTEVEG